jgi:hypothetical protein
MQSLLLAVAVEAAVQFGFAGLHSPVKNVGDRKSSYRKFDLWLPAAAVHRGAGCLFDQRVLPLGYVSRPGDHNAVPQVGGIFGGQNCSCRLGHVTILVHSLVELLDYGPGLELACCNRRATFLTKYIHLWLSSKAKGIYFRISPPPSETLSCSQRSFSLDTVVPPPPRCSSSSISVVLSSDSSQKVASAGSLEIGPMLNSSFCSSAGAWLLGIDQNYLQ